MIIHPNELSTKFLENLFENHQSNLIDFKFESVGSGQVGDCYRIFLNWKIKDSLPETFIAKCPANDQASRYSKKS